MFEVALTHTHTGQTYLAGFAAYVDDDPSPLPHLMRVRVRVRVRVS